MKTDYNNSVWGVKYQIYTHQSMKSYLDALAISQYQGWKREEGVVKGTELPWISYEHPDGTWMHFWNLREDGRLTKSQFNPNHVVNLKVSTTVPTLKGEV